MSSEANPNSVEDRVAVLQTTPGVLRSLLAGSHVVALERFDAEQTLAAIATA